MKTWLSVERDNFKRLFLFFLKFEGGIHYDS